MACPARKCLSAPAPLRYTRNTEFAVENPLWSRTRNARSSHRSLRRPRLHRSHRRTHLLLPPEPPRRGWLRLPRPPPLLHPRPPRECAAQRGRWLRLRRTRRSGRGVEPVERRRRLPLHAHPRRAAGLHRGSRDRGPGVHARRHPRDGWRSRAHQPARARRPGHRPLGAGRFLRDRLRLREERGARIRAQPRALRPAPLGPGGLRELQRGAARDGDRTPGEPGIPGVGHSPAGARRDLSGVSGHGGGDGLAHDDGERAGGGGLGGRGNRGGGGAAGAAVLHAAPRGGGGEADRRAARGGDRDRPGAARDRIVARAWRRGPVRGVLRRRALGAHPARQGHPGQHVSRVRGDGGVFSRRRRDADVPARHGSQRGNDRTGRTDHPRAGPLPHRRHPRSGVHLDAGARPLHHRAERGGAQAPPGPHRLDGHPSRLRARPPGAGSLRFLAGRQRRGRQRRRHSRGHHPPSPVRTGARRV